MFHGTKWKNAETTEEISEAILCLPIYGALKEDEIRHICRVIRDAGEEHV